VARVTVRETIVAGRIVAEPQHRGRPDQRGDRRRAGELVSAHTDEDQVKGLRVSAP
jgi:hypothetical protein